MKISDILKQKSPLIRTVQVTQTVREAISLLNAHKIGALLVTDEPRENVLGVISERDIVQGCDRSVRSLDQVLVNEWMTRRLVTCLPQDNVRDVMSLMTQYRVRHVPVVEENEIIGLVSIGDVVKCLIEDSESQLQFLKEYAFGVYD